MCAELALLVVSWVPVWQKASWCLLVFSYCVRFCIIGWERFYNLYAAWQSRANWLLQILWNVSSWFWRKLFRENRYFSLARIFQNQSAWKIFRATYPQPKAWKYRIFVDDQSICCLISIFSRKTWICILLQPSEWILLWCISGVQEALGLLCTLKRGLFLMVAKVKLFMKYLMQ